MASGTINPSFDLYNNGWALHFASSLTGVFLGEFSTSYAYSLNQYGGANVADGAVYFDPPAPPAGEGYVAFVLNASFPNANNTYAFLANGSNAALTGGTPRGGTGSVQWNLPRVMTKTEWSSYGMRARIFNDTGYPHPGQYLYPGQLTLSWFTTAFPAPAAVTLPATDVRPGKAVLNGTIDTDGYPSSWYFEYGPTTAYGSTTPIQNGGSPTEPTAVAATIANLLPTLTYHYRLVVTNTSSGVVSFGDDETFASPGGQAFLL